MKYQEPNGTQKTIACDSWQCLETELKWQLTTTLPLAYSESFMQNNVPWENFRSNALPGQNGKPLLMMFP